MNFMNITFFCSTLFLLLSQRSLASACRQPSDQFIESCSHVCNYTGADIRYAVFKLSGRYTSSAKYTSNGWYRLANGSCEQFTLQVTQSNSGVEESFGYHFTNYEGNIHWGNGSYRGCVKGLPGTRHYNEFIMPSLAKFRDNQCPSGTYQVNYLQLQNGENYNINCNNKIDRLGFYGKTKCGSKEDVPENNLVVEKKDYYDKQCVKVYSENVMEFSFQPRVHKVLDIENSSCKLKKRGNLVVVLGTYEWHDLEEGQTFQPKKSLPLQCSGSSSWVCFENDPGEIKKIARDEILNSRPSNYEPGVNYGDDLRRSANQADDFIRDSTDPSTHDKRYNTVDTARIKTDLADFLREQALSDEAVELYKEAGSLIAQGFPTNRLSHHDKTIAIKFN